MNTPEDDEDSHTTVDTDLWESSTQDQNEEQEIIIDVNSENMSIITESEDESLGNESGSIGIESVENEIEINSKNSDSVDELEFGIQDQTPLGENLTVVYPEEVSANIKTINESLGYRYGATGMKTVVKIVKKSKVTKYLITKDHKVQINKVPDARVRNKVKVIDEQPKIIDIQPKMLQNAGGLVNSSSSEQSVPGDGLEKLSPDEKGDPNNSRLAYECLFRDSEKQPIIFDFGDIEEDIEIKPINATYDIPVQPKQGSLEFKKNEFLFGCPICTTQCGRRLQDKETVSYHMLTSHEEVVSISPVCPLCLYKPPQWPVRGIEQSEEKLRIHMESLHPSHCSSNDTLIFAVLFNPQMVALKSAASPVFKTTEALYIHIASHKNVIRHKCMCPHCFKISPRTAMNMSDFISTRSYTDHLKSKHEKSPFVPHFLELLVKINKVSLNESEKIHVKTLRPVNPLEESFQTLVHENEGGVQPHTRLDPSIVHNYALRPPESESIDSLLRTETPYLRICPKVVCPARRCGCDFACWNLKLLTDHIQSHLGSESFNYYFLCSLCLKPYVSIYDAVLHAKNTHSSFMNKKDLNAHERKWGLGKYANESYDTKVNLRELLRNLPAQDDTDYMETYNTYLVMKQLLSESDLEPATRPSKDYERYEVFHTTRNVTKKSVGPRAFKEAWLKKYAEEHPEHTVQIKVEKDSIIKETSELQSFGEKEQQNERETEVKDVSSDDEICGYIGVNVTSNPVVYKPSDIPFIKFPQSGGADLTLVKEEVEDPGYGDLNTVMDDSTKSILKDLSEEEEFEDNNDDCDEEINGHNILSQKQALEEMKIREKELHEFCGDQYNVVSLHELGFIMMAKPGRSDFGFCIDFSATKVISLSDLLVSKQSNDMTNLQRVISEKGEAVKVSKRMKKPLSQDWELLSSIKVNQGSGYLSTVYFPDERLDIANSENFCVDAVEIAPGIKHSMTNSKLWVIQEAEGAFQRERMSPARRTFILNSVTGSAFSCGIDPEAGRGKEMTDNLYRLLPKDYKPSANLNNCTFTEVEGMCVGFQGGIVEHVKIIVKEMADDLCYQCPYCNFVNISVYRIAKHIVRRHQNLTFDHIEVFLKTHTLIICCRHCDFVSFDKLNLWRHFENYHRVRDYGVGPFSKPLHAKLGDLKLPPPTKYHKPIFSKEFLKLKKDHYKCSECDQSSEYAEEISKHLLRDHPLSESIRLLHTEMDYISTEYQSGGERTHIEKSLRFFCILCKDVHKSADEIDTHVYSTHSKGRLLMMCNCCDQLFFTRNTMVRHIDRRHSGLERLTCSMTYLDCKGLEKLGRKAKKKPVFSINTDGEEFEVGAEEVLECSMSLIRHRVSEKSLKMDTYKNKRTQLVITKAKKRKATTGSHLLEAKSKAKKKIKRKRKRRRSWGSNQTSSDEEAEENMELVYDDNEDDLFDLEAEVEENLSNVIGSGHIIEYDNAEDDIPYTNPTGMGVQQQEGDNTTVKSEPVDTGYEPQLQPNHEVKQEVEESVDSVNATKMVASPPAVKQEQPDYVSIEMVDFEALQPVVQLECLNLKGRTRININELDIKPNILRRLLTSMSKR